MAIEIYAEKVVERGVRKLKVMGFDALDYSQLPEEYTAGYPNAYKQSRALLVIFADKNDKNEGFCVGAQYSEAEFNKGIELLRKCGQRLHEINLKIKEETKDWEGQVVVVI